ncbi:alpha-ketoglutarate-dependent dioxygenase AlkB [Reyranella sp. CPCC 100927]|uniref:alpha-ketoglutarate-dependent dioxygenase AlkB n=1 Tax=Reyranella sp. CPCC 100927 TaxID=2599616 RepID=UPI0011B564D4|nr:alpha-ketoglutarate-dependent dioxygenase AlkB [Reyranella sp. CPCC 100927]TWT10530.1 alpha-ketoglutarate-dependent dioxygenase AlkB [Reyranella sp. CPCC 100927]
MAQSDLFSQPLPPGLCVADDVITSDEENALIAAIDGADLSPFRFQGWTARRQTAAFGLHYDYGTAQLGRADPIPEWLTTLRARAAQFAHVSGDAFVQVLLTRYDPGAGIGWHRDRPVYEHVVGISLGTAAVMRFRRRRPDGFDRAQTLLAARSIYHLSGGVRHQWEHSIAPMTVTRWSITFRSLSEKGYRQAQEKAVPS